MPKRSLQQVLAQIDALQQEAAKLRASEMKEVVARIREAIAHYGLTPDDLFPARPTRRRAQGSAAGESEAKPSRRRRSATTARSVGVPKYQDPGTAKTWTGQGKRPKWFVAALESGKQAEELLIK